MRTCVRVQRMPPRKEASSTMTKPSRLNWVDLKVNMKRPPEISRTTRMSRGFWAEEKWRFSKRGRNRCDQCLLLQGRHLHGPALTLMASQPSVYMLRSDSG